MILTAEQKLQDRILDLEEHLAAINCDRIDDPLNDDAEEAYQQVAGMLRELWNELGGLQA